VQLRRTIAAALVIFSLSGCDSFKNDSERLATAEAEAAGRAYGERTAEIEALAREAAVYQGCEWLIPICPASITDPGKRIVDGGYAMSGGTSSYFWIIVVLKFLAVGAGLAVFLATLASLYYRWLQPGAKKLAEAKEVIASSHQQAAEITKTATTNAARIDEEAARAHQDLLDGTKALLDQKKRLEADLETLRAHREADTRKLQKVREEIKLAQAEKDLMRGFD